MNKAGIRVSLATIKHAQTFGMIERSHQRLKQILKMNVSADRPLWDRYVNLAVMAHNTTYHHTLKCSSTEVFHGRVPYNALDRKFGNPLSFSRSATDTQSLVDILNTKFKETHSNKIQIRLASPIPESFHTEYTHRTETENQPDQPTIFLPNHESEQHTPVNNASDSTTSSAETSVPKTRSKTTRYSLWETPVPKTYNNLIVYELLTKPALFKFMQRKSANP